MKLNQSCRGKEKKLALLKEYNIYPISFVKLLEGQKKIGCCGELTDKYYAFEFVDRKDKKKRGGFFVGYHCGREFLELLGIDPKKYPLFNPLKTLSQGSNDEKEKSSIEKDHGLESSDAKKVQMDPLNEEIYNAIHIVITAWSGAPYGDYGRIINFIKKNPSQRVSEKVVKKVNFLISRDGKNRSLMQIVDELKSDYPEMKDFKFDLMNQIIEEMIASGKEDMNYIQ